MPAMQRYKADRHQLNPKTRITSVYGGKGGIGKTFIADLIGENCSMRGKNVLLIDLDGNPGLTPLFLSLEKEYSLQQSLAKQIKANPRNMTIQRLLLNPEQGIGDITLIYPFRRLFMDMQGIERDESTLARIKHEFPVVKNGADLVREALHYYHLADTAHMGHLLCVPNAGTFAPFLADATRMEIEDPSFRTEMTLRNALWELCAHITQGKFFIPGDKDQPDITIAEIDEIIIDTAGERGPLPIMAAYASDRAILPFNKSVRSLESMLSTLEDLREVKIAREDLAGDHGLEILPAVLNRYEQSKRDWIGKTALPRLERAGLPLCDIIIPDDPDAGKFPDEVGISPFAYNPLGQAVRAVHQIAERFFA